MSVDNAFRQEWLDLVVAYTSGLATDEEFSRLEAILSENDEAMAFYLDALNIHANLYWYHPDQNASGAQGSGNPAIADPFDANGKENNDHDPTSIIGPVAAPASPLAAASRPAFPASALTALGGPTGYLTGWPIAYLIATAIFGIGAIIGTLVQVSHPSQVALDAPRTTGDHPAAAHSAQQVGRITGMVNCAFLGVGEGTRFKVQGSGSKQFQSRNPEIPKSLVSLGDTYDLASGLLEITYNSGAKVILQGPVRYEVDSPTGGFLFQGKLTARVEKRSAVSGQQPEISSPEPLVPSPSEKVVSGQWPVASEKQSASDIHHSSFSIQHSSGSPLFSVRTPSAIVTDLGTEFGVEVMRDGNTVSHVFQGSVRIQRSVDGHPIGAGRVLSSNQSAFVANATTGRESSGEVIQPITLDSTRFVRDLQSRRPSSSKKTATPQVVAWYRLGEDDPGAAAGSLVETGTVNHRGVYPLAPRAKPSYSANAAPYASSLSASFHGADDECLVNERTPYMLIDDFILEAWVCARTTEDHYQFVVYNGDPNRNGYGLFLGNGTWQFLLGGIHWFDSGVRCAIGQWTHLALVCDHGTMQIWVDGRPAGEPTTWTPHVPDRSFSIGCDHTTNPHFSFNGEIDEVRLSQLTGPFKPEMLLLAPTSAKGDNDVP